MSLTKSSPNNHNSSNSSVDKPMKMVDKFVSELQQLDVKLWIEGDRLRYKAPKETLTPDLLAQMKDRKEEILSFLIQSNPNNASSHESLIAQPEYTTVEKVAKLSYKEFVNSYLNPLHPVVITDAIQDWKALSTWTPEFFKKNYGSKEVTVDAQRYQLRNFIDLVLASNEDKPCSYLKDTDIPGLFPELLADIEPMLLYSQYNWLLSPMLYIPAADPVKQRNAFLELLIAGQGTKFPILHFDYWHLHAFIMQVYGEKEFTLFSPVQTEYLYPVDVSSNRSLIPDIHQPDLEQFPLFAKATPIKVIVKPGETIFVPSGWWHTTRMLTPSIAVTMNCLTNSNWDKFSQDLTRDLVNSFTSFKNHQGKLTILESNIYSYLDNLGKLLVSLDPN
ncbi:MAG: cupin-like domain-containing protein [Nostoc sp.]|uniref:cupin-like domain-containing protein n=1 Tax=Nostoc sp. TaxID=1180 RepID=UPI002FF6A346